MLIKGEVGGREGMLKGALGKFRRVKRVNGGRLGNNEQASLGLMKLTMLAYQLNSLSIAEWNVLN